MLIDMEISIATKNDAMAICKHNIKMAKETENIDLTFETALQGVNNLIDDPSKGFYVLARVDDHIVGQLMITFEWSDWRNSTIWWIQSVYVSYLHRRKGIFQSLLSFVQELAKNHGISILRLYVHHQNTSAIEVYKKLGMNLTEYHMFESKVPDV